MKMTCGWALPGDGRRRMADGSARRRVMVVVAAAVAVVCAGLLTGAGAAPAAAARAGAAGVRWGRAEGLRGNPRITGSSGAGQDVTVSSLSCWSVNNCAAGGTFIVPAPNFSGVKFRDFVVVERNGRWGRAEQLPGIPKYRDSTVSTVSCAARGYCVAGGKAYLGPSRDTVGQAFVATLKHGRWQAAVPVRITKVPNNGGSISSVSCLAAGRCVAAGNSELGAFVTWQVKGVWRQPALSFAGLGGGRTSLSCWTPRTCVAARWLTVTELHGVWRTAEVIPGVTRPVATSVSCARDGYCAVGGYYPPPTQSTTGEFVATGRNGTWGTAVTWPGLTPSVVAVSCQSAGNCTAAGVQGPGMMGGPGWVVSQRNGVWGAPEPLPGTGTEVAITSLSCWSASNCAVGGSYLPAPGRRIEPFVASETNGRWSAPEPVPGITALNKHGSYINPSSVAAVSCPSARQCTAAGSYTDAKKRYLPFVTGP
jgi:hypothetical protein